MYPTSFISFLIHQNYLAEYITCNKMCSFFLNKNLVFIYYLTDFILKIKSTQIF